MGTLKNENVIDIITKTIAGESLLDGLLKASLKALRILNQKFVTSKKEINIMDHMGISKLIFGYLKEFVRFCLDAKLL